MILVDYLHNNTLIRHYSSAEMKIRQEETGTLYDEAVDIIPCPYVYTETDIPIVEEEISEDEPIIDEPDDSDYAKVGKILMGINN